MTELEIEKSKEFYEKCVQSWDEFEVGQAYETLKGGARFIVESKEPECYKFRILGWWSDNNFHPTLKLIIVNPKAEPLKWYAGMKVELRPEERAVISVPRDGGEIREKREPREDGRVSTFELVKAHLDAGNELTEEGFYAFLKEQRPDIKDTNLKNHLKSFITKKYFTKVKVEGGVIKSVVAGLEYDE